MGKPESVIQRSFGAGELAPALHGRADQTKYLTGLRTCRNFLVRKAGGISNRPGTRYIATCKTNSSAVMLLPYLSEIAGESVLIEAGVGYLRFFVNGAAVNLTAPFPSAWSAVTQYVIGDLVESAGVYYYAHQPSLNQAPPNGTFWYALPGTLYEIPTPFGAELFYYAQSGRTIAMTHPDIAPYELIFENLTRWVIRAVNTAPAILPPTNVVLTPGGAGALKAGYVVTSAAAETYEESIASAQVINAAVAEPTEAAPHVITWDAVVGAAEYYVYGDPYGNGIYGFLGIAGTNSFRDAGLIPDFSVTPPLTRTPFNAVNKYPRVCAHYQQRRFFANTKTTPDAIYGSRVGFPSNFGISSPLQDDDAITFRLAGNHHHPVRHMLGLAEGLIVLTDAGGWTVRGGAERALTPSAINPDQDTYVGAYASVRPVVVGNSILYVQARGSIVNDLQFNIEVEGLAGRDLTVFSDHLVKGFKLRDLDYALEPDSVVWAVRDDGVLLGLTYLREHDVWGWHRHDTDGTYWDVCVVPEATRDAPYFIVFRTVDGSTRAYIERLESREIKTFDTDVFFVDAGLSYSGAPVNNVAGLSHLKGKVCAVVGDGAVIYDGDPAGADVAKFTVNAGGTFPNNFPSSYSNIHVGLPIRFAEFETLDLDVQAESVVRDKRKRVGGLSLLLEKSARTFRVGPSSSDPLRRMAPLGPHEAPLVDEFTGLTELTINSHFNAHGRVFLRHTDPLPLTVLAVVPTVELGG